MGFFGMRWFLGIVVAFLILVLVYLGSVASSLARLASAVRAGDAAAVLENTDVKALTHSLTDQVVGAYLDRVGATRRISPMEKMLVNAYGGSIADAMIAKMLTADRLTQILKSGKLQGAPDAPAVAGIPALADLPTGNWLSLLGRINFIQPVLLGIRISDSTDPDAYAAIDLHAEGLFTWKLAGLELPKAVVRDLAANLPVK
jgi:hypothetical protein